LALLTVVTSVLNGRPYIEGMLRSVPQHAGIQHLVIDAGSTDGTWDLLKAGVGLDVVQMPGSALYGAWNRAVELARGGHLLFINADDELAAGAVSSIVSLLGRGDQPDIICGKAEVFRDGYGANRASRRVVRRYERGELVGPDLTSLLFGAPIINAKVLRRDLVRTAGGFDPSYAFTADREFLLRILLKHPSAKWLGSDALFCSYRMHAGSKTLMQSAKRRVEISAEHDRMAAQYGLMALDDIDLRRMLQAWRDHERSVRVIRAAQALRINVAIGALLQLMAEGPAAMASIQRARRARCRYRSWLV
jgi:glycosyltransferase involved in cell wall biosynthesis